MRGALPKHSGKTYAWIDTSANAGNSAYWLEDVDVNGIRTMHGPVSVESASTSSTVNESIPASTLTLDQLSQVTSAATGDSSHPLEKLASLAGPSQSQRQKQFDLAAHPAVKIMVKHEGWYSVTQSDLVKSGLDPNVDPALLHLYAEANEQPIEIIGATSGPGGFGPQASINFYGTAIDTPYSGTRVYWLVLGFQSAARQLPLHRRVEAAQHLLRRLDREKRKQFLRPAGFHHAGQSGPPDSASRHGIHHPRHA
jgi:hypothetical protein